MTKTFRRFKPGTVEYVVHHGMYMASRGKKPSETYLDILNPRKAFAHARHLLLILEQHREVFQMTIASMLKNKQLIYSQMDASTIETLLRHIAATSPSPEVVIARIKDELGYPEDPCVTVIQGVSRKTRDHWIANGGSTLVGGALVMIMVRCPLGSVILV